MPIRPEDSRYVHPSASTPASAAHTGAIRPQGGICGVMSACHCLNPRRHLFSGLRRRRGGRRRSRCSSSGRSSDSLSSLHRSGNAFPAPLQTGHQWLSSRLSRTGVRRPFGARLRRHAPSGAAPRLARSAAKHTAAGLSGILTPFPFQRIHNAVINIVGTSLCDVWVDVQHIIHAEGMSLH